MFTSDFKTYVGATAGDFHCKFDIGMEEPKQALMQILLLYDDGAGGTNRKCALSNVKSYVADVTLTTVHKHSSRLD